jgi:ABC-type sulfate transport system substrate-binding protein
MALSESDKVLIKHLDISEQDFEKLSLAEQGKKLKDCIAAYIKERSVEKKPEYFENAKAIVPTIIAQLDKPLMVYAKNVGANSGGKINAYAFAGYAYNKKGKKFLVFNPESDAENIKVFQIDESDIILSDK